MKSQFKKPYAKRKYAKKKARSKNPYRKTNVRTLQIATKRNTNMTLKFVTNQTYVFQPGTGGQPVGTTAVLCFRANSIYKSQLPTSNNPGVWASQDPLKYSNDIAALVEQNADGYAEWTQRFQHFCVTGSKITATFEPSGTGCPTIMTTHVSGIQGAIQAGTTSAKINELPYVNRSSIVSNLNLGSKDSVLSAKYSARKFEGVKDPVDNSNLRGRFEDNNVVPPLTGLTPTEQTFFYVSFAPINPATTVNMPQGVVRVKVEYIVKLKEPTETNLIQLRGGSAHYPGQEM